MRSVFIQTDNKYFYLYILVFRRNFLDKKGILGDCSGHAGLIPKSKSVGARWEFHLVSVMSFPCCQ